MALDLGELRAGVTVDDSKVGRGLAGVVRKFEQFTSRMSRSSSAAGSDAGSKLTSGMAGRLGGGLAAAQRRVEAFYGRVRTGSGRAGEDSGERLSGGLSRRLGSGLRSAVGGAGKVIGGGGSMLATVALGGAGVLAGLGAAGVAALGAVGVAGGVLGTQVASGNEQAQISFETMLGSAEKAKGFLDNLKAFAAETPFEFPELQTAASSLISAGVNADKVIPIMRTLGDVTSGMGTGSEGVKRATIALQQMSAAGRITGEDLNQLRDAGIPVYDLLAKATGKSKEEVVKLAGAGKLGKKELGLMMEALESGKGLERFSGLMEKQATSLAGMWSTLKDTVGQGLAGVMQQAFPLMKAAIGGVSAALGGLFKYLDDNKEAIGSLFGSAQRILSTFGKVSGAVLGAFFGRFTEGMGTLDDFANMIATHEGDIVEAFIAITKVALGIGDGIAQAASIGLRGLAFLVEKTGDVRGVFLDLFGGILNAAAGAFSWIPGLGPKLAEARAGFELFANASKDGTKKAAQGMTGLADGIDNRVRPAIHAAQGKLEEMGKTEVGKARQRDQARKLALAMDSISESTTGSRIKLKRWADVSSLASGEQRALKSRLDGASRGLREQLTAARKAGAGQEELTKTWREGKKRLYEEFLQMGLSKREAQRLADKYAGIKPKVQTKITQPGMPKSKEDADALKRKLDAAAKDRESLFTMKFKANATSVAGEMSKNTKSWAVRIAKGTGYTGGVVRLQRFADGGTYRRLPGYTPGRDVHTFYSDTAGRLDLSGGEGIVRPEVVDALGGEAGLARLNRKGKEGKLHKEALTHQSFAEGGLFRTVFRGSSGTVPGLGTFTNASVAAAERLGSAQGRALMNAYTRKLNELAKKQAGQQAAAIKKKQAGTIGGKIDVNNPSGRTSYRGGTFTNLFAAALRNAEKIAGMAFRVQQGGFRPTTSYSGSTHNKDAIDFQPNATLIRAFRKAVGAAGDRTGLGNWGAHAHGVPAPSRGYGSSAAQGQYRDYVSMGGASQSLRSRWGLQQGTGLAGASGIKLLGEGGAELIVNPQLRRLSGERVVNNALTRKAIESAGRGPVIGGDAIFQSTGDLHRDMELLTYKLRVYDRGGVPSLSGVAG